MCENIDIIYVRFQGELPIIIYIYLVMAYADTFINQFVDYKKPTMQMATNRLMIMTQ